MSVCLYVGGKYVCIYVHLYIVLPIYAGVCIPTFSPRYQFITRTVSLVPAVVSAGIAFAGSGCRRCCCCRCSHCCYRCCSCCCCCCSCYCFCCCCYCCCLVLILVLFGGGLGASCQHSYQRVQSEPRRAHQTYGVFTDSERARHVVRWENRCARACTCVHAVIQSYTRVCPSSSAER